MRRAHSANAMDWLAHDPVFWVGLGCWALVFYALLRVPQLDLQPARTSPPILWTLLPAMALTPPVAKEVMQWVLLTVVLALAVPVLFIRSPIPEKHPLHPECAALPGLWRLRLMEAVHNALALGGLLLLFATPLLGLALRSGSVTLPHALMLGGLLVCEPLWLACLWALAGAPGRAEHTRALLAHLAGVVLTLTITSLVLMQGEYSVANPLVWHALVMVLLIQLARMRNDYAPVRLPRATSPLGDAHVSS